MGIGLGLGTLQPTPLCAYSAHITLPVGGEVLRLGRREEREAVGRSAVSGSKKIVFRIERGDLLDILDHPNPERYGGQCIFVVRREDYVYLVPFVED
jgi:hypothetical protein